MIGTANTPQCDELFDSVGQTIFGLGLQLEQCLEAADDPGLRTKLDTTIRSLHDIIGRIRERGDLHCGGVSHEVRKVHDH